MIKTFTTKQRWLAIGQNDYKTKVTIFCCSVEVAFFLLSSTWGTDSDRPNEENSQDKKRQGNFTWEVVKWIVHIYNFKVGQHWSKQLLGMTIWAETTFMLGIFEIRQLEYYQVKISSTYDKEKMEKRYRRTRQHDTARRHKTRDHMYGEVVTAKPRKVNQDKIKYSLNTVEANIRQIRRHNARYGQDTVTSATFHFPR